MPSAAHEFSTSKAGVPQDAASRTTSPFVSKVDGKEAQNTIYISWDEAVKKAFERYEVVINKFFSDNHSNEEYKY